MTSGSEAGGSGRRRQETPSQDRLDSQSLLSGAPTPCSLGSSTGNTGAVPTLRSLCIGRSLPCLAHCDSVPLLSLPALLTALCWAPFPRGCSTLGSRGWGPRPGVHHTQRGPWWAGPRGLGLGLGLRTSSKPLGVAGASSGDSPADHQDQLPSASDKAAQPRRKSGASLNH